MKTLKKGQLKRGFAVTSATGPTHSERPWIWNHREEKTAGARFSGTERQRQLHSAPIEFFLYGGFVVHVDAKYRQPVNWDCYGSQRCGRGGSGRADTGAGDYRGLCSTRNDSGGGHSGERNAIILVALFQSFALPF